MKLWQQEGESKLEKLIEKIENHPLIEKIQADEAAKTLSERQEAANQIKTLREEQVQTTAVLRDILSEKELTFSEAKATFEIASSELNKSRLNLQAEILDFERQIRIQNDVLIESSDPKIDTAIGFFRDHLEYLRKPGRIDSRARGAERNIFSMTKTVSSETNKDAVLAAMDYCRLAIRALELMKLEPELDSKRIEKMKAEIPSIDTYSESTGEKPLPGSGPTDPLLLAKSDDQVSWEIGKINEKFKRLITKRAA